MHKGRWCLTLAAALLFHGATFAQWLKYPTPGIPRNADGKADLTAKAPIAADGKPDLSGIWSNGGLPDIKDLPLTPSARASLDEATNHPDGIPFPLTQCLPHFFLHAVPITIYKIVQTPGLIVMLFESQGEPLPRQIFLDGRPLPKNPEPSWMGYSVGHWEDGILIVETIGLNDRGMMPFPRLRMTETMRIVERFQRLDFGHMKLQITIEDPKTFMQPWTFTLTPQFQPNTELLEYVCEKNDDILKHMVGSEKK